MTNENDKVQANSIWQTHKVEIEEKADRFWLKSGDGGRSDHQVRLEPDGSVFIGYTEDSRKQVRMTTLLFSQFDNEFRNFVDNCISKYSEQ